MDASGFGALASHFPDRTVVTYDPRGLGRSVRKDGRIDNTPTVQADDVHAVIETLGAGPVEMFASSVVGDVSLGGLEHVCRHDRSTASASKTHRVLANASMGGFFDEHNLERLGAADTGGLLDLPLITSFPKRSRRF
jgi:pimeloyl-ACP methyl ester carboxylesterase